MSSKDVEHTEELYPEQDVLIHCKGDILFEDFEHKIRSELLLDNFLEEAYNAVNDFKKKENRDLLEYILINKSYIKSVSDIFIQIDMEFYLSAHFASYFPEILNSCVKSSVKVRLVLTIGGIGADIRKINIDKIKTDTRKEIQCTGRLVFPSNRKCLFQYENLAFRSENGFFRYPNSASPDIFIMDSTHLHLRGHCFVAEDAVDKNMAEVIKAFQESIYGIVAVKADGKEQVFSKQPNGCLPKWGDPKPPNYYW